MSSETTICLSQEPCITKILVPQTKLCQEVAVEKLIIVSGFASCLYRQSPWHFLRLWWAFCFIKRRSPAIFFEQIEVIFINAETTIPMICMLDSWLCFASFPLASSQRIMEAQTAASTAESFFSCNGWTRIKHYQFFSFCCAVISSTCLTALNLFGPL